MSECSLIKISRKISPTDKSSQSSQKYSKVAESDQPKCEEHLVSDSERIIKSGKRGKWLYSKGVDFPQADMNVVRQRKSTYIAENSDEYQSLESLDIRPGMSRFYREVYCGKSHQLGPFNLAAYWKRKYRGKGPKEAWFILTSLDNIDLALSFYSARWGIETMFKDCKVIFISDAMDYCGFTPFNAGLL